MTDKTLTLSAKTTASAFSALKRLRPEQLIDQLERLNVEFQYQLEYVDNQYQVWRWRILWELRQHYSKVEDFYAYIEDLRVKKIIRAGCHQAINRQIHAGRFCEQFGIHDLNDAGLVQSAIYELSRPKNRAIVEPVFKQVKKKNLELKEVIKLLDAAHHATASEPALEASPAEPLSEPILEPAVSAALSNAEIQETASAQVAQTEPARVLPEQRKTLTLKKPDEAKNDAEVTEPERRSFEDRRYLHLVDNAHSAPVNLATASDHELVKELSSRDASSLSDDQIIAEILLISERYRRSFMKLIALWQACIKHSQALIYRKTV